MATMGKYCKAYLVKTLREFSKWSAHLENAKKEQQEDGTETETPRALTDDNYLYLQENYVVTDGIFKDTHIIFDEVTPEWITYCRNVLAFEIPEYAPAVSAEANTRSQ